MIQNLEEEDVIHHTNLDLPNFYKVYNAAGSYLYSFYNDTMIVNTALTKH